MEEPFFSTEKIENGKAAVRPVYYHTQPPCGDGLLLEEWGKVFTNVKATCLSRREDYSSVEWTFEVVKNYIPPFILNKAKENPSTRDEYIKALKEMMRYAINS